MRAPVEEFLRPWIQSCQCSEWGSRLWGLSHHPGEVGAWVWYPTDRLLSAMDTPGGEYPGVCIQSCHLAYTVISVKGHLSVLLWDTFLCHCCYTFTGFAVQFTLGGGEILLLLHSRLWCIHPSPFSLDMSGAVVIPDATQKSPMYLASIYSFWLNENKW